MADEKNKHGVSLGNDCDFLGESTSLNSFRMPQEFPRAEAWKIEIKMKTAIDVIAVKSELATFFALACAFIPKNFSREKSKLKKEAVNR